jgi:capsular exopolysaccharide synthesis family protein
MSLSSDHPGQNVQQPKSPGTFRAILPQGIGRTEEDSLRSTFRVLLKRRGLIIVCALGTLGLALLICAMTTKQFVSTATLLVDKQNSSMNLGGLGGLGAALGGADDLTTELTTHATVLQSDTTTLRVIEELGLDKVYAYHQPVFGGDPLLKAEQGLPLEKATATRERLLKIVKSRLIVKPQQDTRLITITYRDGDPQRAADVANAFVSVYINEYLQSHFQATARASNWLGGQLDDLKARVNDSQQKLSDYESKTGLSVLLLGMGGDSSGGGSGGSSVGSGGSIPAVQKLSTLNEELTAAEADRIEKEAIYQLTQTQSPEVIMGIGSSGLVASGSSTVVNEGQGLSVLDGLRTQEAQLRMQYGDLLAKYGANNPHLGEMRGQLNSIHQSIEEELQRINDRAKNDLELAKQNEAGIRKAYDQQQQEVNKLNDNTIQLEVLAGEALSNRELYDGLYTRLQQANIQAGVSATNLDLVDQARPRSNPSRPDWRLYPAVGLGGGLLLGIGLAFVRESLDDSIVTTEQVEGVGLLPVLSYIPLNRSKDAPYGKEFVGPAVPGVSQNEQSLLLSKPNAPVAESYRVLRTSILLSTSDKPLRVLLLTSPLSGDGKTTISYNLAIAFAQQGKSVLLIDADMRKPNMHSLFRVPRAPGLSEVITGGIQLRDAVKIHESLPNLSLLPAGTTPPSPAELLDSKRFEAVLDAAKEQYDLVLIDSPPVLMVTDPVILSTKADATVVVLRSQKTTRMVLKRAVEALSRSHGRKLGFVINGLDTKSAEHYYAYGYYGDNKYYGEEA